jgi:TPR repeat protein
MRAVLIFLVSLSILCSAQQSPSEIPAGVKIKAATNAENALAKTTLEKSLSGDADSKKVLLGDISTCGPTLWAALKNSADETLLHSKIVTGILPDLSLTVPERGLVTDEQRRSFWKLLLETYPSLKGAKIRKPTADEIRYYWATIPFESIEGPFLAAEAGPQTFVLNFQIKENKPVLLWIDLVGDLHRLADQNLTADEIAEFERAAGTGIAVPMYTVGRAYFFGWGVEADLEKGRKLLDDAAQKGSFDAQMLLGALYMSGTSLPKDHYLAAKYLLQAAGNPNADVSLQSSQALAQYWLATMFENGIGVDKSHEKAIQFLQAAAKNGSNPAQYDLGNLFNAGLGGMPLDKARACELFELAANQGHTRAMHNVGYCYQTGSGGKKDDQKAINYYMRAAEAGDVRSARNLGLLFGQLGQAEKSYFWLRIAETSGDTQVRTFIDKVTPHLTQEQVEASEKQITAWLKAHEKKS